MSGENARIRLPIIGRTVELQLPHPWAGSIGKVESHNDTLMGLGAVVRLDNGKSFFVFNKYDWKYV